MPRPQLVTPTDLEAAEQPPVSANEGGCRAERHRRAIATDQHLANRLSGS